MYAHFLIQLKYREGVNTKFRTDSGLVKDAIPSDSSSFSVVKKTDRFSLVTFSTRVKIEFRLAYMHRANKDRFKAVIRELTAGSATNLCDGLVQGKCLSPNI